MPTCIIIGAFVVSCAIDPAARPTPAQAAAILTQSDAFSNRTNWHPIVEERRGPQVIYAPAPALAPKALARESKQARANRLGVPDGWTPLEYAILNGGR